MDKFLGNAIFEARVVRRLTQEDMAKAISEIMIENGKKKGISRQAYNCYELGNRSMPDVVFQSACKYLGLNWKTIFNEALEQLKVEEQ